ncbi:TetR/AcrR family transcriptional regulator [Kribbella speibonae]|uniref:TetR/AcrR family transcriptional regulator n=1 Tax=Kribbella speibonae TaxID=1572660 RepID=A0A4R0IT26_9ACTN|nr:TetR/AcrR family transcriptional regulator [Kribbella speibonae]TCC27521.1 TetR/AcrR family transcriptional regulator [Kribbella speibonae]TCC35614.1 TetR/AcrR family transcriptional regulator [Kribbella speibonae]
MVDDGERRRRAPHLGPERRRPLVLDAALEVFSAKGYAGTTMQSVADAAGVTKPVVYDCFANRDELLLALLAREEQHLVISIVSALPADPNVGTPQEHVLEGVTAFLTAVAKQPQSWRIVFGAQYGAAPVVAERVLAARAFLVESLRLTLVKSLPGVTDPDANLPVLAELLASMIEACARMLVVDGTDRTPAELARTVAQVVGGGFGTV